MKNLEKLIKTLSGNWLNWQSIGGDVFVSVSKTSEDLGFLKEQVCKKIE
jgi:hypothetical protein